MQRGKLGLNILPLKAVLDGQDALPPNARYGLAVTAVVPGSAADAAGIRKGTRDGCACLNNAVYPRVFISVVPMHNTLARLP